MKKLFFASFLFFASLVLQGQAPSGYYSNANGKTGNELKSALHDIIGGHTTISYQQIWNAFWSTDNKGNGVVWDMYSDVPNGTPPYSFKIGQNQCGEYEEEGECYNREHSWPKSWFSGDEQTTPGRDLHHIFPTDGFVNAQRSSFPFGEVNNASWTSQNGSKLGSCKSSLGYSGTVFEPIDEYKGDFARAIMYMSVRYYGEDDDWGSSGMTNKSVIKDWAIQMLMRWSEQDPVSAKEIARNNVIYNDYQHNRNPFVDHPEYARAIWDPDWHGVEYNVTYASVQNGSVSGPATAVEGTMVTLTATPSEGYMIGSWSVYKTGDSSTTVSVNSDGTFTMPAFNVTVSANFVVNNTYYAITCETVQHGSISANASTARSGRSITLTASPATGYNLYSWYVYKTGDMNTVVYHGTSNTFTMPAFDVTVTATFVQGTVGDSYVKVTTAPSDWSGEYLIVYENGNKAFDGSLTALDATNNTIPVTINSNSIASTTTTDASKFTIAKSGNNYTIKSASGYYIGRTASSNGMNTSTGQQYANTISFSNGAVVIAGNAGPTLQFNSASDQSRFRYFTSNQKSIQLYRKTAGTASVPTHTIHFNSNGGSGTMDDQVVDEFEATALNANSFTRTGYLFMGWNTQADGAGQYYTDGATVTLLNDLTLYAQWKQFFTITLATIQNGSVTVSQSQAVEGDLITLTATPVVTYEFDHWTVTDASGNPIFVTENQFEMPASDVTVDATFVYVGQPYEQKYHLVTSTDQLVAGRTYLIVNSSAKKALGTTQNSNNRSAASVAIASNVISSIGGDVCELTLGGSAGAWTFFDANWGDDGGYLYAAGGTGNNNYLRTQATLTDEGKWTITFDNSYNVTIKTIVTTVARHTLMYNSGSSIFSCYASGQQKVCLFIRSEEFDHIESETIANLFTFDKHTVRYGATLTVSGTATCNDASHLVFEDGAQLIHGSNGVQATVKKSIEAYTNDGGWYTIAVPFTDFAPSQIATDDYDLYGFDEDTNLEWVNHKALTNGLSICSTNGYLYAHNPSITLRMTGTLNSGTYSQTVDLSYGNSDVNVKGYNLLGNPTAHDITFSKTSNVSDGYFYLNNSSKWVYTVANTVPAGRGFLVKANAEGQTVTLNPQGKGGGDDQGQYLSVSIDAEMVYVKMTEGVSMPLLNFKGQSPSLCLYREGKPYVMLVRDEADSVELHFRACYNGRHQLCVDAKDLDLKELYLIDRLTGTVVDLLQNPNYSFEGCKTDDAKRFQLVFKKG